MPADGTSAAKLEITETSVRPRFMGSFRTSHCLPIYLRGVLNEKHNGDRELNAENLPAATPQVDRLEHTRN